MCVPYVHTCTTYETAFRIRSVGFFLCVCSPTCYCNVAVDVGQLLFEQDKLCGGGFLPLQLQHHARMVGQLAALLFVQCDVTADYICKPA